MKKRTLQIKKIFLGLGLTAVMTFAGGVQAAEVAGGVAGGGGPTDGALAGSGLSITDLQKYLGADGQQRLIEMYDRLAQKADLVAIQGLVTFDTAAAPCAFASTAPLKGVQEGVFFSGVQANGGAILDICSNFGIEPLSGSNFLAFNRGAIYTGGGIAKLPEILLSAAARQIDLNVSSGSGVPTTIALLAIGSGGLTDFKVVSLNSGWQKVSLAGPAGLVLIVGDIDWLVIDNVETF